MKTFMLSIFLIFLGLQITHAQTKTYTSLEVDNLPIIEKCPEVDSNSFQECLKVYILTNMDITNLTIYKSAKAYVQFVITASGKIKDIKVRTSNKNLEKESIKLINNLKIKSPAMLNGTPVSMTYVTPISFKSMVINSGTYNPTKDLLGMTQPALEFKDAAELPMYKECEATENDSCFEDLTTNRIINFLKSSKNLKSELKIGMELKVYFIIQSNGEFSNAVVVCNNNKIMKELPYFINNMKVSEAAKDQNQNFIQTYFMKTIVF